MSKSLSAFFLLLAVSCPLRAQMLAKTPVGVVEDVAAFVKESPPAAVPPS